jgi:hypothetical protein
VGSPLLGERVWVREYVAPFDYLDLGKSPWKNPAKKIKKSLTDYL